MFELSKSKSVLDKQLVVEENFNLIQNLNRGRLLFPTDILASKILINYLLFNKLLKTYEDTF